ncbi:MAG TPA: class I SAM-dependent methyltransferase [Trebonia sp.]
MNGDEAALLAYYERGRERDRLSDPQGDLEFTRTKEILLRALPPAPAVVADIGGGPGRYALWLAGLGYQVEHRDLMPLHVSQLTAAVAGRPGIRTPVADARELDLPDQSVDAVLFLGPLYHLTEQPERVRALREAAASSARAGRCSRRRSPAGQPGSTACCGNGSMSSTRPRPTWSARQTAPGCSRRCTRAASPRSATAQRN